MNADSLRAVAYAARANAYAPYSGFHVGAALRSSNGNVYGGANVENASFTVGICAERSAIAAAVTAGDTQFEEIVLVSDAEQPVVPCGACRQALSEFAPDLRITSHGLNGKTAEWSLAELLPHQFRLNESNGISK